MYAYMYTEREREREIHCYMWGWCCSAFFLLLFDASDFDLSFYGRWGDTTNVWGMLRFLEASDQQKFSQSNHVRVQFSFSKWSNVFSMPRRKLEPFPHGWTYPDPDLRSCKVQQDLSCAFAPRSIASGFGALPSEPINRNVLLGWAHLC